MRNRHLKYICKPVDLTVETTQSAFTAGYGHGDTITVPVAHHDGNYFAEPRCSRRCAPRTGSPSPTATTPTGRSADIAGILSDNRRVLGMMPHPERAADPALGGRDGAALFSGLVGQLAEA